MPGLDSAASLCMTFLSRLIDLEKTPPSRADGFREYDLNRYRTFLDAIGNPHDGQLFIHLAGTKGKGSTAAICEGILRGLGYPTALYSSPHLTQFGERVRFDGQPLTEREFEDALASFHAKLHPTLREGFDGPKPWRTVFETLTSLALVEAANRSRKLRAERHPLPQIVVWETGLGGRLDCTNVVEPLVSIITTLGMDHMSVLGDTIEKIAWEKAGIMKRGRPVIVSRQEKCFEDRVWPVLIDRAKEVGAPLVRAWEHNPVLSSRPCPGGQDVVVQLPDGREMKTFLPLRGMYQTSNLEAAIAACWYVAKPDRLTQGDFTRGLPLVDWPGRFEVLPLPNGFNLVLDGAHCPLSARRLGESLDLFVDFGSPGPRGGFTLLYAMQRDKKHEPFLRGLMEGAGEMSIRRVICYPVGGTRGATPMELADAARGLGLEASVANSAESALYQAVMDNRVVVAAGTLYTISKFKDLWKRGNEQS